LKSESSIAVSPCDELGERVDYDRHDHGQHKAGDDRAW
jgi:hypothetical protein